MPGTKTVLIVDDEASFREVFAQVLRNRGYNVLEAANGEHALEICGEGTAIDAVLTDVCMPTMDGTSLASELRERRPEIRIVLMSGIAGAAKTATSSAPFLRKPFRTDELLHVLESALKQAEDAALAVAR
jgi:two-component system cell cycle sensor histidine kinase/response regulator CckA